MCEFDTDVKTELELSPWWRKIRFLSKSTYQNTQAEQKKDVLVVSVFQETKNYNLFDKNRTQDNIKCHIQHEES